MSLETELGLCQTGVMTSLRLLPLVLLLSVSAQARAASATCPRFFPGGRPPVLVNPKLETRTTLLCNDAYAVLASGVTHGALWSAEHPTTASLEAARDTTASTRSTPRTGCQRPTRRRSRTTGVPDTTAAT